MGIRNDDAVEASNSDVIEDISNKVLENISEKGDTEVPSKTWKSTVAFFLFLVIYAYSVYDNRTAEVIDITGYIALFSMAFMMLRDKRLGELLNNIIAIRTNK